MYNISTSRRYKIRTYENLKTVTYHTNLSAIFEFSRSKYIICLVWSGVLSTLEKLLNGVMAGTTLYNSLFNVVYSIRNK